MEINGLPLHPLVVHAAVIFGPLGALAALGYVCLPRLRDRFRLPMLALVVVAAGALLTAYLTGKGFLNSKPQLKSSPQVTIHTQRAGLLLWATIAFAVLTVGAQATHKRSDLVGRGVRVLLGAAAVAVLVLVVLTGDAGARAVWG
jgi:hypothetical protein